MRAPSSLCPRVSFRIDFRCSKVWKGPAPGVPGVREPVLRIHNRRTNGTSPVSPPATRPRGHLLRCVPGGFPPPPVARLPRALLARLGVLRRAGKSPPPPGHPATGGAVRMFPARTRGHGRASAPKTPLEISGRASPPWMEKSQTLAGKPRKSPVLGRLARPAGRAAKRKKSQAVFFAFWAISMSSTMATIRFC